MIYDLAAAIAFLTRLPTGRFRTFDWVHVARASRWFPLVGALIGGIDVAFLWIFAKIFPSPITAILIVALDACLTGAMHLDGLADTADGFGGGRTRDDVLRIMRDHAIGAYGAVALILVIALRIATVSALIDAHRAIPSLIVAPVLGRWSAVLIGATLPYARSLDDEGPRFRRSALIIATITALAITVASDYRRGLTACGFIVLGSGVWAGVCRHRIGGVTGDTLGAAIAISESVVLLIFTALR